MEFPQTGNRQADRDELRYAGLRLDGRLGTIQRVDRNPRGERFVGSIRERTGQNVALHPPLCQRCYTDMRMQPIPFPPNFLWGAATSSHQIEGGNINNDWWDWEGRVQPPEKRSGETSDQWNRWPEDAVLMEDLGHNAHRLSLEWSRIEPQEGIFDEAALAHYKELLKILQAHGIKTVVTLHHFTNPQWLAAGGGWSSSCVVKRYTRYATQVVATLGEHIDYLITINEPGVYAFMSYQTGIWPPQERSSLKMFRVLWNMARAHRAAYTLIKQHSPHLPIGIAQNMTTFEPVHPKSWRERIAAALLHRFNNFSFYWLTGNATHDFLGVNYYFHRRLDATGRLWPRFQSPEETNQPMSDLGWELHPTGLGAIVRSLRGKQKPILITEHGLADADDSRRPAFLEESLRSLSDAVRDGVPVIGYLHWSLLDNFEWADGFTPRFGLIEVDYKTQKRTPRTSALLYKEIIKSSHE